MQVALCKLMNPFMNSVAVTYTCVPMHMHIHERPMHRSGRNVMRCLTLDKPKCIRVFGVRQHCNNFGNISFSDGWSHCSWNHIHPPRSLQLDSARLHSFYCRWHELVVFKLANMTAKLYKFVEYEIRVRIQICMPLMSQYLPYVCKIARNTQIQTFRFKQHMTKYCTFWFMQLLLLLLLLSSG